MSAEDPLEGSDSKIFDTIGFVLSFLRNVGLDKAESALLSEIAEKYPDLGASPSDREEEEQEDDGDPEDAEIDDPGPSSVPDKADRRVRCCLNNPPELTSDSSTGMWCCRSLFKGQICPLLKEGREQAAFPRNQALTARGPPVGLYPCSTVKPRSCSAI